MVSAPATFSLSQRGAADARIWRARPSATVTTSGTSTVSTPSRARAEGRSAAISGVPAGERMSKMPTTPASVRPARDRPARASARSFAPAIVPSWPQRNAGCRMAARESGGAGMGWFRSKTMRKIFTVTDNNDWDGASMPFAGLLPAAARARPGRAFHTFRPRACRRYANRSPKNTKIWSGDGPLGGGDGPDDVGGVDPDVTCRRSPHRRPRRIALHRDAGHLHAVHRRRADLDGRLRSCGRSAGDRDPGARAVAALSGRSAANSPRTERIPSGHRNTPPGPGMSRMKG